MVFSARRVLQAFDLGIGLHVPVKVAGAGEGRRQNAHRRALGECAHHAGGADAGADIGRAGDHRLDGLAGALRADVLQHQTVLLEDAGVLAERRRLVFPVVDLADRDLERVFGEGRAGSSANGAARPSATAWPSGDAHAMILPLILFFDRHSRGRHSTPGPARPGSPNLSAFAFGRPARLGGALGLALCAGRAGRRAAGFGNPHRPVFPGAVEAGGLAG